MTRRISALDPRAGIWLLLLVNIGMFCEKYAWQGIVLSGMFLLLLLLFRQYSAAWKGAALIVVFRPLLKFVFPLCPRLINMLDMMRCGGERVKEGNLGAVLDWYSAQR